MTNLRHGRCCKRSAIAGGTGGVAADAGGGGAAERQRPLSGSGVRLVSRTNTNGKDVGIRLLDVVTIPTSHFMSVGISLSAIVGLIMASSRG